MFMVRIRLSQQSWFRTLVYN